MVNSQRYSRERRRRRPCKRMKRKAERRLFVWCEGENICFHFHRLPPVLGCRSEFLSGLKLSGFSMWHYVKLVIRGFLRVPWFPLPPSSVTGFCQWNKTKDKCNVESVKTDSGAAPLRHVACDMLYVISDRCVARDLQTMASRPHQRTSWRFWGDR